MRMHIRAIVLALVTSVSGAAATRAAETAADRRWNEIEQLLEASPPVSMIGRFNPDAAKSEWGGIFLWYEAGNRLLRELGLKFSKEHPSDPRRWEWFRQTRTFQRAPIYAEISHPTPWISASGAPLRVDVAAQEAWKRDYIELRAQCIRATDAPPDLRIAVWVELLDEPFSEAVLAAYRGADIDLRLFNFEPALQGAEEIGQMFPDSEDEDLRNCVGSALSRLASRDPAAGQRWAARLETSPNAMIRSLAAGSIAVNQTQAKPVEMGFVAIDGREVDLARLRGKVVLLEFRGVTWCGACREEEPFLRDVYSKYRDKGLEIVGITYENKENSRQFVLKYLADRKLVWPHYFDGKGSKNPFIQQFGITGVPRIYVLDQTGRIVGSDVRGQQIEPAVRALLGLPTI